MQPHPPEEGQTEQQYELSAAVPAEKSPALSDDLPNAEINATWQQLPLSRNPCHAFAPRIVCCNHMRLSENREKRRSMCTVESL